MHFVFLFLLLFPKGGFKVGEIPVTWSYLLLAGATLFRPLLISKERVQAFLCVIPFQCIVAYTLIAHGAVAQTWVVALLVNFFLLPMAFFLFLPSMDLRPVKAVFWVALYGLLLFGYQTVTGEFFEIPFLTSNYGDLGLLSEKSNLRALGISKLISTYNNGNIYGLCILMLLPLYSRMEDSRLKKFLVKLSLFLTLSRTVWVGLLIHELFIEKSVKKALFCVGLVFGLLYWLGYDPSFLWDHTLGGRLEQFDLLQDLTLFPSKPFECIHEIVYVGILSSFGLVGLFAFLLAMVGPLCFAPRVVRCGLINYLFISCSDGAILLIPVMAIYYMMLQFKDGRLTISDHDNSRISTSTKSFDPQTGRNG